MRTINLNVYDYDGLRVCPFCADSRNLTDPADACPHFVAAFQFGSWSQKLCPPVTCDGFMFRHSFQKFLFELNEVVCKTTPATKRHPAVWAFYHPDPAFVTELRLAFAITPVDAMKGCPECGVRRALVDEGTITCEHGHFLDAGVWHGSIDA
jgi:hypothetical protein